MEENALQEQPILNVTVKMDWDTYRRYNRFASLRKPVTWIIWMTAYLLLPLCILLMIKSQLQNLHREWFYVILLSALDIFYIVLLTIGPRMGFRRRSKLLSAEDDLAYAFYEDCFHIAYSSSLSAGGTSYQYDYIKQAYETKTAFYLQTIEKNRATFLFAKKYIVPEQTPVLRKLLTRKFGGKFKPCQPKTERNKS